jgi:hypothetical protein
VSYWSELIQSNEFQNLIQWGVEVRPDAAYTAKKFATMWVLSALNDPNIAKVIATGQTVVSDISAQFES